ncbi:MAG TPA: type IV toxin-antitoxin system AbiEi family antitoxin domain-containing protein [Solirubrobacteraceae bacterium]|jgi:predicted transcriptional regulator of viral defense system|nr:type IV toxin-antitoxin system AbiEi family antitoxin domain-containing protein [Solirubrobacteraceae bacterium]
MSDNPHPDVLGLETEAYQQGGYFNAAQARTHAVSRQLLEHHVRRGRFERIRRGLYRVQGYPTAENDDMREAWMTVAGADAVLSHESALALLDLSDNIPDTIHLLIPRKRRGLRRPAGVILHTHPDNEAIPTVWRDGLPLTAPARTLLDVAPNLQPEQLSMAVTQALRRGLLTAEQLQEEASRRHKQDAIRAILSTGVST